MFGFLIFEVKICILQSTTSMVWCEIPRFSFNFTATRQLPLLGVFSKGGSFSPTKLLERWLFVWVKLKQAGFEREILLYRERKR